MHLTFCLYFCMNLSFFERPKPDQIRKKKEEKTKDGCKTSEDSCNKEKIKRIPSGKAITRQQRKMKCIKENKGRLQMGEYKKLTRLTGCCIKITQPVFKTEVLIYQSKATIDVKLSGKLTLHLDPKIKRMWA